MTNPLIKRTPAPHLEAARVKLLEVLRSFGDAITPAEQLALLSFLVGQVLAMQDQRTVTPDTGLELIHANIKEGNMVAIAVLMMAPGAGGVQ